MVLEGVLPDGEEELIPPAVVVTDGEVEDGVDEAADVLDAHSLGVQINHGGGFVLKHGAVEIVAAGAGGSGLPVRLPGIVIVGGGGLAGLGGALQSRALARG